MSDIGQTERTYVRSVCTVLFFFRHDCWYCQNMDIVVTEKEKEYGDSIHVKRLSIYEAENVVLFNRFAERFHLTSRGVPFLVAGNDYILGYYANKAAEQFTNLVENNKGAPCYPKDWNLTSSSSSQKESSGASYGSSESAVYSNDLI